MPGCLILHTCSGMSRKACLGPGRRPITEAYLGRPNSTPPQTSRSGIGSGISQGHHGLVSSFDVAPTIVELLDQPRPPGISGRSLEAAEPRWVFDQNEFQQPRGRL